MSIIKEYPIDYGLDKNISTKGNKTVHTSEGYTFFVSNALKDPVDVAVNNYSNLILTKKDILSNIFEDDIRLKQSQLSITSQFTTYLAPVEGNVVDPVRFVSIASDNLSESQVSCDGYTATVSESTPSQLTNDFFFEIEFVTGTENLLRIKHYDTRKTIYLTYNYLTGKLYFDTKGAPSLGSGSSGHCFTFTEYANQREDPQIFEYFFDEAYGYIKLFKYGLESAPSSPTARQYKLFTIAKNTAGDGLALISETFDIQDPDFWNTTSMFKVQLPEKIPMDPMLSSFTVYNDPDLTVNKSEMVNDNKHNILLHDEFLSSTPGHNSIPLKNQLPNTFEQTANNLIPGSNKVDYRDYTAISAGGNETHGNEKISLLYDEYTTQIELPSDKISYFHLPIEMYPYTKLYIGDCGLIESGAIPGDAPINSDKIFKKQANYKETTPYGEPSGDHTGQWLCAWLYSSTGDIKDAKWVDRYYDTNTYSYVQALSTSVTTIYEDLIAQKNTSTSNNFKRGIFDVQSSIMLEPNTYYAYHHIGNKDIKKYIDGTYKKNILIDEFRSLSLASETTYTIPNSANDEKGINISFTLKRDAKTDWKSPIGYHILGNYTNKGISIYNRLDVTPLIYMISTDKKNINVYNNDLVLVTQIGFDAPDPDNVTTQLSLYCVGFTVPEPLGNIFCFKQDINQNYYLYEYNHEGAIVEFTKLGFKGVHKDMVSNNNMVHIKTHDKIYNINLVNEVIGSGIHSDYADNVVDLGEGDSLEIVDRPFIRQVFRPPEDLILAGNPETIIDIVNLQKMLVSMFRLKSADIKYKIKAFTRDQDNNTFIIFNDDCEGVEKDILIAFDRNKKRIFQIPIDDLTTGYTGLSDYVIKSVTNFSGKLEKYILIIRQTGTKTICYKVNRSTGSATSTTEHKEFVSDITTCKNFSSDYKPFGKSNKLFIKHKLFNIINKDDYKTIIFDIDVEKTFSKETHHISYNYDPQLGLGTVYVDGKEVSRKNLDGDNDPGKYAFSGICIDDFKVGSLPYINSGSISTMLKQSTPFTGNANFEVLNFQMYNTPLNHYAISLVAANLGSIDDIKWSVPYTKRHFVDEIHKVQKHEIPGIKSNELKIQLHTNDSIGVNLKSDISTIVNEKVKDFIPGNVNLQPVDWI